MVRTPDSGPSEGDSTGKDGGRSPETAGPEQAAPAAARGAVGGGGGSGDFGSARVSETDLGVDGEADRSDAEVSRGGDLRGLTVVVTAGPTREPIDPVRYISNHSSGKMGYALAAAARDRGARVVLVSGPVSLEPPAGVEVERVETAEDMLGALESHVPRADVLIMAAAVADYRVVERSAHKIKRTSEQLVLHLEPNPDILATMARQRRRSGRPRVLVGFALETDALLENARSKLLRKGCDLLVANLADQSIGLDHSTAFILDREGVAGAPGSLPKEELAHRILDHVAERLERS